jgi:hypothetical protein
VRHILVLLIIVLLTAFLSASQTAIKSAARSSNVPTCASIPDKQAFIRTLYDRIAQDEVMPPSGKLALASLHIGGTSTFAFWPNDGAVLKFNILDFPGSIEAHRTTSLLIGTGLSVAEEYDLCLNGIEVVFYQDKRRLWLVVTAVPPWRADQISLVPLGRRGD